jgi:hypothetical protein
MKTCKTCAPFSACQLWPSNATVVSLGAHNEPEHSVWSLAEVCKQIGGEGRTRQEGKGTLPSCRDMDMVATRHGVTVPVHTKECTGEVCALAGAGWTVITMVCTGQRHTASYRMLVDPEGNYKMALRVDNPCYK